MTQERTTFSVLHLNNKSACELIKSGGSNKKSFKHMSCNWALEWKTTDLSGVHGEITPKTERTQTVSVTFKGGPCS